MLGGSEELLGSITEVIRLLGSLVISLDINFRYGPRLTEYQNGLRAICTKVGRAIGLTSDISTIEQEMAIKCLQYDYRVMEVPAHEYRRKGGESKVKVMSVAYLNILNLARGLLGSKKKITDSLPKMNSLVPGNNNHKVSYSRLIDFQGLGGDVCRV